MRHATDMAAATDPMLQRETGVHTRDAGTTSWPTRTNPANHRDAIIRYSKYSMKRAPAADLLGVIENTYVVNGLSTD